MGSNVDLPGVFIQFFHVQAALECDHTGYGQTGQNGEQQNDQQHFLQGKTPLAAAGGIFLHEWYFPFSAAHAAPLTGIYVARTGFALRFNQ